MPRQEIKKQRTKANKLPVNAQIRIAEHYINSNEGTQRMSSKDVANLFTEGNTVVTYNQVNAYVRKYKSGIYNRARRNRTDKGIAEAAVKIVEANPDIDVLIAENILLLIAKIKADAEMSSSNQSKVLSEVMMLREKQQRISLERHVKAVDAKFLHALCKHFEPGCTEQKAIQIVVAVRNEMRKTG